MSVFGAVDIGASGGRVMAGIVTADRRVELEAVHRFPNGAALRDSHLRWDFTALVEEVLVGLSLLATRHPDVTSIGIDTWAVDYGLLDAAGHLLADPIAYRDSRTDAVIDKVHARVSPAELYAINGLQHLPFTTLYQLATEAPGPWSHAALIPDLLAYALTGELRTEITNASTTGLLDVRRRTFSAPLLAALDLPAEVFPPLVEPGQVIGRLTAEVAARTGLPTTVPVVAVGSHDTASAVVGVPATGGPVVAVGVPATGSPVVAVGSPTASTVAGAPTTGDPVAPAGSADTAPEFAYVSSGTWSLVGIELDHPVLTDAAREANFTNEGGVDGRIRFLRNVGGLWLLQESVRVWQADQADLLAAAAELPPGGPTVDVDDPRFIPPGDMPTRIREACAGRGPVPDDPAAVVRCILDSLAVAYARTVQQAAALSGRPVNVIHIVGGGSQNALLCQLTADLSGLPVVSGPVEATALGNVLVQARAAGALTGDLDALRAALAAQLDLHTYHPIREDQPCPS